ncbi:MAG: amino acid ABC transporter ATP-binding protein [Pasteurella sp.]|nr:amino acid ABC transporter ATP-binding protein [Pasteurella sp.]
MIKISNIKKSFADNDILCGIDLSIKKGEVVVILGASGSGKTTFLRCLNALEIPDDGIIEFKDDTPLLIDFSKRKEKKKLINQLRNKSGMVFQQYHLFPHKTALENITEGPLVVQKKAKNEVLSMARWLLEQVGLADKENNYPHQLSGGQQQRVAIARAMAIKPRVMLFDEPTSALDPELVGEVLQVMRGVADAGQTMVIVTHEIKFAREVADKVIFIDKGKIVEEGNAISVIDNPQHQRTQKFLSRLL